jgi:hypothetical protein
MGIDPGQVFEAQLPVLTASAMLPALRASAMLPALTA